MPEKTLGIVLAGGQGSRLAPLTDARAKPAVPFGKNRIVDFVLANVVNSNIRHILVLTQYAPQSLYSHIQQFWIPMLGYRDSITITPPKMRSVDEQRYVGTANAVWQNWDMVQRERYTAERVAIFGGDHIYMMDVSQVINYHRKKESVFTICVDVVTVEEAANALGVLEVDENNRVIGFVEKPPQDEVPEIPNKKGFCYASMGNYIAETDLLGTVLQRDADDTESSHDFGKDIIPALIAHNRDVYAYPFDLNKIPGQDVPYWRDVGTLQTYYAACNEALQYVPPLNLANPAWPIPSCPDYLPEARVLGEYAHTAFMGTSGGVVIDDASVRWSRLGRRVMIRKGAVLHGCHLFDNVDVGEQSILRYVICDKHVRIPPNTLIGLDRVQDDARGFHTEVLDANTWLTVIPEHYTF